MINHRIIIRLFSLMSLVSAFGAVANAQKAQTMTVKVFFHNEKLNPDMMDCTKAFPTNRTIPKTKAPARAALDELFKGTTDEEKAKGFWAFDRESTTGVVKSLNVKNGAAYLNFTKRAFEQLGNAATSCGGGFFAMVEETLMQFPSIKKVYYAVEGNADDFYEWVQVGECPYGKHCAKSNFK
jgi:spore germination protein GerM